MTLQQLAEAAGLSIGYLSQIERNRSQLPISTLRKICDAMGIHVSFFFPVTEGGPAAERDVVVRVQNRRRLNFTGTGIVEELLSPNLSGPLELLISTLEPGADSGEYTHDGSEAGVVIAGALELWVNGRYFKLETGDSFSFSSHEPHRCRNPGNTVARVVWVITPPYY